MKWQGTGVIGALPETGMKMSTDEVLTPSPGRMLATPGVTTLLVKPECVTAKPMTDWGLQRSYGC